MSMSTTDGVILQPHVADVGTRSFVPLSQYLNAQSLPDDDPGLSHDWDPLFVSYQRELDVNQVLDEQCFETFLPMRVTYERVGKKVVSREEPAIHNLIFVKSYYERIRWMKMYNRTCTALQFTTRGFQTARDTIIPLRQMERFIDACRKAEGKDRVLFLRPDEIEEFKGREVRFIKGDFAGVEGYIQRVNKNKMVIVTLQGIQSIALPVYRRDELEFI